MIGTTLLFKTGIVTFTFSALIVIWSAEIVLPFLSSKNNSAGKTEVSEIVFEDETLATHLSILFISASGPETVTSKIEG